MRATLLDTCRFSPFRSLVSPATSFSSYGDVAAASWRAVSSGPTSLRAATPVTARPRAGQNSKAALLSSFVVFASGSTGSSRQWGPLFPLPKATRGQERPQEPDLRRSQSHLAVADRSTLRSWGMGSVARRGAVGIIGDRHAVDSGKGLARVDDECVCAGLER